jgi:hypothetical protein
MLKVELLQRLSDPEPGGADATPPGCPIATSAASRCRFLPRLPIGTPRDLPGVLRRAREPTWRERVKVRPALTARPRGPAAGFMPCPGMGVRLRPAQLAPRPLSCCGHVCTWPDEPTSRRPGAHRTVVVESGSTRRFVDEGVPRDDTARGNAPAAGAQGRDCGEEGGGAVRACRATRGCCDRSVCADSRRRWGNR